MLFHMQFFWTFLTFLSTHRVHINDPNKEYLHFCNVQIKKYIENNNYVIILKMTLYNLFKKYIYCLLFNSLMQRVSIKKKYIYNQKSYSTSETESSWTRFPITKLWKTNLIYSSTCAIYSCLLLRCVIIIIISYNV